jgi:phage tail-like protein
MALLSQTALRADPVLNHNFVVGLIDTSSALAGIISGALSAVLDVAVGGFSEVSGLEMTMKIEEHPEGGNNGAVLKFPGRVSWTNLTLKRGLASNTSLWDWHYSYVQGRGKRRSGVIVLLTELKVPNNIWFFKDGLPVKYSGPSLNATQNAVAIEAVEIAHQGIYQVPGVGIASGIVSAATGGGAGGIIQGGGSLGGSFL